MYAWLLELHPQLQVGHVSSPGVGAATQARRTN